MSRCENFNNLIHTTSFWEPDPAEHIADEAAAREARGLAPHAIPGPYRGG